MWLTNSRPRRLVHRNEYITVCKQIIITLSPFKPEIISILFINYGLLRIPLYWADHGNQPRALKTPQRLKL